MSNDPIRAVLVGCGGMSGAWLRASAGMDDVEIVGLVDLDAERAQGRKTEFQLSSAETGTDMEALLDALSPDVVFDCTVPEAHTHVTVTALERGCHVMGEKPLSDSMENARRSLDAARRAGRIYAVIQNRRYQASIRRIRRLIDAGQIGPLTTVDAGFYKGVWFGGFRHEMDHVLLLDMAIHTFDQARLITGADPVSVYCREWNPQGSWFAHGAAAIAVFQMTDDIVFTYRGSWCAEGTNTSWQADWRIHGVNGSLLWDGDDDIRGERVTRNERDVDTQPVDVPELSPDDRIGGHEGLLRDFIDAVKKGGEPETVAHDNVKSLAMVFGAIDSAAQGREVEINL